MGMGILELCGGITSAENSVEIFFSNIPTSPKMRLKKCVRGLSLGSKADKIVTKEKLESNASGVSTV